MTICIATIWYNDPSIIRMITSLPEDIPILVIDGVFEGHDGDPLSDEAIREQVKGYSNVTLIDAPNLDEPKKRQIYLDILMCKYTLVIDSDEYIQEANWPSFTKPTGRFR